jgi:3-hydroxyisobutyrate dehydrogenase-like beta-hydroxyacid dehydrogenase
MTSNITWPDEIYRELKRAHINQASYVPDAGHGRIDLAHKDLSLIMDAANQAKVPLPVAAATREMFSMARAGRYAQSDFSAMIDVLCDLAGIAKPRLAAPDAQATAPRG